MTKPEWGTPEYDLRGLQRIVSTVHEDDDAKQAYLSATISFLGDGDMIKEAEVFHNAAAYFRAHPEIAVSTANWSTYVDGEGRVRYSPDLGVVPPQGLTPEMARELYPNAER
jgi:hypothetical protein